MYNTYLRTRYKGPWQIFIKLYADIIPLDKSSNYYEVNDKIGIKVAENPILEPKEYLERIGFLEKDMKHFIKGLKAIQDILSNYIDDNGILIVLHNLQVYLVDFQEEALAMAIIQLMSEVYGFPMPEIPVYFDRPNNKYIFDL